MANSEEIRDYLEDSLRDKSELSIFRNLSDSDDPAYEASSDYSDDSSLRIILYQVNVGELGLIITNITMHSMKILQTHNQALVLKIVVGAIRVGKFSHSRFQRRRNIVSQNCSRDCPVDSCDSN
ncbi:hypothetical protein J6590_093902 [Homalodisca vitripennis]|nr:hypothetical protein J6590_087162 [Homalodisca vitripennis]KAG8309108.1 hypothetical protein J6590_093902 [Homalodisca vitripennis]